MRWLRARRVAGPTARPVVVGRSQEEIRSRNQALLEGGPSGATRSGAPTGQGRLDARSRVYARRCLPRRIDRRGHGARPDPSRQERRVLERGALPPAGREHPAGVGPGRRRTVSVHQPDHEKLLGQALPESAPAGSWLDMSTGRTRPRRARAGRLESGNYDEQYRVVWPTAACTGCIRALSPSAPRRARRAHRRHRQDVTEAPPRGAPRAPQALHEDARALRAPCPEEKDIDLMLARARAVQSGLAWPRSCFTTRSRGRALTMRSSLGCPAAPGATAETNPEMLSPGRAGTRHAHSGRPARCAGCRLPLPGPRSGEHRGVPDPAARPNADLAALSRENVFPLRTPPSSRLSSLISTAFTPSLRERGCVPAQFDSLTGSPTGRCCATASPRQFSRRGASVGRSRCCSVDLTASSS